MKTNAVGVTGVERMHKKVLEGKSSTILLKNCFDNKAQGNKYIKGNGNISGCCPWSQHDFRKTEHTLLSTNQCTGSTLHNSMVSTIPV